MRIKLMAAVLIACSMLMVYSCGKDKTNISRYDADKSHHMGDNCMECHKKGKWGKGWFNVAGTVYDSLKSNTFPNATVNLYTGSNGTGTLKYTIQADAKGNFFTTEDIDFGSGLYFSVKGKETTKYMSSTETSGKCNSCHGVSTDKIWTE